MHGLIHEAIVEFLLSRPDGVNELAEAMARCPGLESSVCLCEFSPTSPHSR